MQEFLENHGKGCAIAVVSAIVVIALLFIIPANFLRHTDTGNVGIVIHYGTLDGGKPSISVVPTNQYVWINPFGGEQFVEYPTAVQSLVLSSRHEEGELDKDSTIPCFMNGGGQINFGLSVNWQVDPTRPQVLYFKKPNFPLTSSLNSDIATTIVYGAVVSDTTTACSNFTWQDVLGDGKGTSKVQQLQNMILTSLQSDLQPDGILINQIFIKEKNPSDQIKAVLDAQTKAQQSAFLKQQAQNEADAQRIKAQADADTIRIVNDQLAKSPSYIQYLMVKEWDGHLPQVESTNNSSIIAGAFGNKQ